STLTTAGPTCSAAPVTACEYASSSSPSVGRAAAPVAGADIVSSETGYSVAVMTEPPYMLGETPPGSRAPRSGAPYICSGYGRYRLARRRDRRDRGDRSRDGARPGAHRGPRRHLRPHGGERARDGARPHGGGDRRARVGVRRLRPGQRGRVRGVRGRAR